MVDAWDPWYAGRSVPVPRGYALTAAQRLILGALIDNPDRWHPANGSVALVLSAAGLPVRASGVHP